MLSFHVAVKFTCYQGDQLKPCPAEIKVEHILTGMAYKPANVFIRQARTGNTVQTYGAFRCVRACVRTCVRACACMC